MLVTIACMAFVFGLVVNFFIKQTVAYFIYAISLQSAIQILVFSSFTEIAHPKYIGLIMAVMTTQNISGPYRFWHEEYEHWDMFLDYHWLWMDGLALLFYGALPLLGLYLALFKFDG